MLSSPLLNLVKANRTLFWSTSEADLTQLNREAVVEVILNYGNEANVKALINILGLRTVSDIFYQQVQRKRSNYSPQTKNFFKLYFNRHVKQK
jgi:hypothetical protein